MSITQAGAVRSKDDQEFDRMMERIHNHSKPSNTKTTPTAAAPVQETVPSERSKRWVNASRFSGGSMRSINDD